MALSDKTIKDINEIIQWWNWHRSMVENASLEKQNLFLLRGMNEIIRLFSVVAEDINDVGEPQIVLPKGLNLNDSIRG